MADEATLRDSISEAFDTVEKAETPPAPKVEAPPVEQVGAAKAVVEAAPPKAPPAAKPPVVKKGAPAGAAPPPPSAAPPVAPPSKAPSGWKPAAREKWAGLPPEIQEEALRWDKEVQKGLREASDARKFAEEFADVVAPYDGFFKAAGHGPMESIASMLQTAAALRTGTPVEKAQLAANLIAYNGIDLGMLGRALQGQLGAYAGSPQGQPPPADPRQVFEEMFEQRIATAQEQRNERLVQHEVGEMQKFAQSHEFFNDVKDDMELLFDRAAARGVDLSWDACYEQAVKMNQDIAGIVDQRAKATAAGAGGSAAAAKLASSALRPGSPAPAAAPAEPVSLRDDLEAAWEQHAQ